MNETANTCTASQRDTRTQDPCCNEAVTARSPIKVREIHIQPQSFGYLIQVGCQSFAIETREKLLTNLSDYLENPEKVERAWMDKKELK